MEIPPCPPSCVRDRCDGVGLACSVLTFTSVAEIVDRVGQSFGASAWHTVTQERITAFARATEDFVDIHLDTAAAQRAGFDDTIAHGLYTLSLGPKFMAELYQTPGIRLGLNYGFNSVRFLHPVPMGSRVRMQLRLDRTTPLEGGFKFHFVETFEIEGVDKPACVAEALVAFFD